MRLKVTLLLLLGLFLKKEFCLASSENEENLCDIKITDFNTYEITCPKPEPENNATASNTDDNQDEEGKMCCRLQKIVRQVVPSSKDQRVETYYHDKLVWDNVADDCKLETTLDADDKYVKMIENGFVEGNSCKVILKSNISESDSTAYLSSKD